MPDGNLVTDRRDGRVRGTWQYVTIGEDDDAETKVWETFGKAAGTHKIEFRSARRFRLGDLVTIRTGTRVTIGRISSVTKSNTESRYQYVSGDLAVTLTELLRRD